MIAKTQHYLCMTMICFTIILVLFMYLYRIFIVLYIKIPQNNNYVIIAGKR